MAINFGSLPTPGKSKVAIDPIEIFSTLPRLPNSPGDLWATQKEALVRWFQEDKTSDIVISLNTGAGKSLIGLLIAQSEMNSGRWPVVYACATNDLVLQTAREAEEKLGLRFTTRIEGGYSNTLFEEGKAFCITTYNALFNSKSVFKGDLFPKALIFDDAHVAEKTLRDSLTVSVQSTRHQSAYQQLSSLIREYFIEIGSKIEFDSTLNPTSSGIIYVPTKAISQKEELFTKVISEITDIDIVFSFGHIAGHLAQCFVTISNNSIEFTPPFIPSSAFRMLKDEGVRRHYLSATLGSRTEFIRSFGKKPKYIEIDTDAGNGERLIVFTDKLKISEGILAFLHRTIQSRKALIAVPSGKVAERWKVLAIPPRREEFSKKLSEFKNGQKGAFVLLSRVDGIDLPADTCRIMVIDGLPTGASQYENFVTSSLDIKGFLDPKILTRVIQLFGRINRGRSDYGFFLIHDRSLCIWMRRDANIALMPDTLRRQIILGQAVSDTGPDSAQLSDFINAVLERDKNWTAYYQDFIGGLDIDDNDRQKASRLEETTAAAAFHEVRYMAALWDKRYQDARQELKKAMELVKGYDDRLLGFYHLLAGGVYQLENDEQAAVKHYEVARAKIGGQLILPRSRVDETETRPDEPVQRRYDLLFKTDRLDARQPIQEYLEKIAYISDGGLESNPFEESIRALGEVLGFVSMRPDKTAGTGPDNLWIDPNSLLAIAFEAKSEKTAAKYSKREIGQCHDHLEWISKNHEKLTVDSLFIVGDATEIENTATPSSRMVFVPVCAMRELSTLVKDKILKMNFATPMERRLLVDSFVKDQANSMEAITEFLRLKRSM